MTREHGPVRSPYAHAVGRRAAAAGVRLRGADAQAARARKGDTVKAEMDWVGDLGRLSWGLAYWNLRKAVFRLRGASGAAPCQHPSDSGRAGQTGCEACRGWRSAAHFRCLCPLIGTGADGRRVCTVDAADVRPFWGRALVWYGGFAAAAALVAVVGAFAALRIIGYRVPFYAVAWPPAWHRIHQARADYFYRMAVEAFSAGDARQGFLALNQVYALDPGNIRAALLLAQFTQVANPEYSDSIYTRLLLQRRGNAEETAQSWFRALLSRGDFVSMGRLSARMLREGSTHAAAWTQGVLFAERMTGDPGEVDRLLAGTARIPEDARWVLTLARELRTGSADDSLRRLELSAGAAGDPFELYFTLDRLTELGRPAAVVAFLDGPGGVALESYDRESLRLDAFSALDWRVLERREIEFLLNRGAAASAVTLVAAHLIRRPDAAAAEHAFRELDLRPLAATAENSGAHVALLCMAGVNGLGGRLKQEANLLGWGAGGRLPALGRIGEFFEGSASGKNPAMFLPALRQLPLEVVYALTAHYHAPGRPAAASPAPSGAEPGTG